MATTAMTVTVPMSMTVAIVAARSAVIATIVAAVIVPAAIIPGAIVTAVVVAA
jgi:hypothetical protein